MPLPSRAWCVTAGRPLARLACRYGCDILSGLQELHQGGIVMMDLKPANVLLSGEGRALLTDFGLAHVLREGASRVTVGRPPLTRPREGRTEALPLPLLLRPRAGECRSQPAAAGHCCPWAAGPPPEHQPPASPLLLHLQSMTSAQGTTAYMAPEQHDPRRDGACAAPLSTGPALPVSPA